MHEIEAKSVKIMMQQQLVKMPNNAYQDILKYIILPVIQLALDSKKGNF